MISAIILLAALGTQPVVFVSSFNGVDGDDAVVLTSTPIRQVRAKSDGSHLYLLAQPTDIPLDSAYSLYYHSQILISGIIEAKPSTVFRSTSTNRIGDAPGVPLSDAFRIVPVSTLPTMKSGLSAVILYQNTIFWATYDSVGTIFVQKPTDFDQNSLISVLIFTKNGQKWLYSGQIDGKYLRFAKSKSPRGPL